MRCLPPEAGAERIQSFLRSERLQNVVRVANGHFFFPFPGVVFFALLFCTSCDLLFALEFDSKIPLFAETRRIFLTPEDRSSGDEGIAERIADAGELGWDKKSCGSPFAGTVLVFVVLKVEVWWAEIAWNPQFLWSEVVFRCIEFQETNAAPDINRSGEGQQGRARSGQGQQDRSQIL